MQKNPAQSLSIRELMPDGFLRELARRTGCSQRATLSGVVTYESTTSKYWPAVLALAEETNPDGFAQWQASQQHTASAA